MCCKVKEDIEKCKVRSVNGKIKQKKNYGKSRNKIY